MNKNIKILTVLIFCLLLSSETNFAQTAAELIARAKASADKRDFTSAVKDSTAAIKLDASNADAFFWRGFAYYYQKDYPNALKDLDESIRLNPKFDLSFGVRGLVRYRLNDLDSAIADYSKSIELNPKYFAGYYNRGVAIVHKPAPDWNAALADFTAASEINPRDSGAFFYLGFVYSSMEKWPESEKYYLKASSLGDQTAELLANLSYVDIKMGFYAQAAMNARAALEIDPQNKNATGDLAYAIATRAKPFDAQLAKELLDAANDNDTARAMSAINRGADVNATYTFNNLALSTALQRAANRGNLFLVRALVSVGANVNAQDSSGNSPLLFAAAYSKEIGDKVEIVKYLLKNKADVNLADSLGSTPLDKACLWSYDDLVEIFIKAGANVNAKDKVDVTPLITALRSGSDISVRLLAAAGADVNAVDGPNKFNSLVWAIRRGSFMKIYLVSKAGASADFPSDQIPNEYATGLAFARLLKSLPAGSVEMRLFDQAANNNTSELISLLAGNPADKSLLNYLLMFGIANDNPSMLEGLVAKGADVTFKPGEASLLTIARNTKKNVAAAYLADKVGTEPETNSTARDEAKIKALIDDATSAMGFAATQLKKGLEQRNAGREKAIWCLSINDAANSANEAVKLVKQAQSIFSLRYRADLQQAKEGAEQSLRETMSFGCPVFLK